MGLFDRWRRKEKKEKKTVVRGREIMRVEAPERTPKKSEVEQTPESKEKITQLIAEYQRLVARREELQRERSELTRRLDSGELTAIQFRKELMNRIQEAAKITDGIRETSSQLIALGHPGVAV
ncbi:MAG: hypothetical protein BAJATHORv1_30427 [Candidatus Thorarchaeota archaeon]|nr:MAG: hypothetical protein BAJATHORv1_30427 [Candidatus Thorarchaeota archaeon]